MTGKSLDIKQEQLDKLKELFPEAVSEGKVDWERLKLSLGDDVTIANERYVLNWAGKSDAFRAIQTPTTATLKPQREQSIDFDTTENIFIEGENLEVLKVLQKSYYGKVKMIYIDPPYNTGNDSFIYPDKFSENKDEYLKRIGDKDEEGYLTKEGFFKKNSKENGQYHSNWLSMMYPRLFLARNLLREDGVIFVSVDDNEVHNLRLLMNEVFGEENILGQFVVNTTPNARDYGHIGKMHEYCMFYAKNIFETETNLLEDKEKLFKYRDSIGEYNIHPLYNSNVAFTNLNRPNLYYPFYLNLDKIIEGSFYEIGLKPFKNSIEIFPPKSVKDNVQFVWRWGKEKSLGELNKNIIGYKVDEGGYRIVQKMRTSAKIIRSILSEKEYTSRRGTAEFEEVMGKKNFSFPKPVELIKSFLKVGLLENDIVLDFFAGSATTGQAVLELNKEENKNYNFILVQLPEKIDEESEAYKAGYKTIAHIGKERIRRISKKIKEEIESKPDLFEKKEIDLGVKVYTLEPSNFKIWRTDVIENEEELKKQMEVFVDPARKTSESEAMAWEIMLKSGFELTEKLEYLEVRYDGKKSGGVYHYFRIAGNELILALDKMNQSLVDDIIGQKPKKVIVLDRLFEGNDQLKTNTVLQMKDAGIEFKTI